MRRRDFLKLGAAAASGIAITGMRPALQPRLEERGTTTVARGRLRLPARTVPAGHTLRFDPASDTTLELTGNLVVMGTLEMKPRPGVRHTLRFVGVDEAAFVGGGMEVLDSDVGLWVMDQGRLDIEGAPRAGWNRTGTHPTWSARDADPRRHRSRAATPPRSPPARVISEPSPARTAARSPKRRSTSPEQTVGRNTAR